MIPISKIKSFSFEKIEFSLQTTIEQYGLYFFCLLSIFITVYFSELSEYRLRVDEEFTILRKNGFDWITFGRWGTSIVESFLVVRPVNPYFSMFMFASCLSISYIMFCKAIRIQLSLFIVISFVLFSGFPTWLYLIEFKGTLFANSLAILFSSTAGYLFALRKRFSSLLFILLLTAAISIYQSSIFIAITISIASILVIENVDIRLYPMTLFSFLRLIILSLASLLLYFVIWKILLIWLDLKPHYMAGFIHIDALLQNPRTVILATLQEATSLFFGFRDTFYGMLPFTGIIFLFGLVVLIAHKYRSSRYVFDKLVLLFLLVAFILNPFSLNVLSGGYLPDRTFIAVPYIHWFFVAMAIQSSYPGIRLFTKILVLLIAIQYIQLSSFFSFSNYFVSIHDQLIASQIYERAVNQIEYYDRTKSYPIEFIGPLHFPNNAQYLLGKGAVTGSSLFEWDGGNPYRARALLYILGMGNFYVINDKQRASIMPEIEKMPLWPNKGSVKNINGIIIVKFDEYSEVRRRDIENTR